MQSRVYRFDQYTIDPTRHEFWAGEEEVTLQLKVFEVLVYLIQNRDRAVCRDELISAVWGRVDVSDHVLNVIVGRARQAVGDSGEEQRLIRTVPRFGYCWAVPVEEVEVEAGNGNGDEPEANGGRVPHANGHEEESLQLASTIATPATPDDDAGDPDTAATPPAPPWRGPMRWFAPLLGLALVALTVTLWPGRSQEEVPITPARDQTALVLPVDVIGDDGANWVRLGIMDLIADRLRAAGQAVVPSDNTVALMSRFDSQQVASSPDRIPRIAQTAAANLVLKATAERIDDHWQVTLRPVHGMQQGMIAQGEGKQPLTAALGAADRMAMMLGYPVLGNDKMPMGVSAVDHVLQQARAAMLSDRLDEALKLMESLGEDQQSDPRVRYQTGMIHLRAGNSQAAHTLFAAMLEDLPSAAAALEKARARYGLAEAWSRQHDYAAAEEEYARAIELLSAADGYEAQNLLGRAYMGLGGARGFQGKHDMARDDYARARIALEGTGDRLTVAKLDGNLGILMAHMTRYAEAIPSALRAAQVLTDFGDVQNEARARLIMAIAHGALMDDGAALKELKRIDEILSGVENAGLTDTVNHYRAGILLTNGKLEAARKLLELRLRWDGEEKKRLGRRSVWPQATLARLALRDGDPTRAAELAEVALSKPWDPAMAGPFARTWLTRVRAEIRMGEMDTAAESVAAAETWASNHSKPLVRLYLGLLRAEYAAAEGDHGSADAEYSEALDLAMQRGIPIEVFQVSAPYTRYLIESGNLDRAAVIAGHVAGWSEQSYDAALLQVRLYHALGDASAWRRALDRATALAGEREIPPDLLSTPDRASTRAALVAAEISEMDS